jgi:hypothetical protein
MKDTCLHNNISLQLCPILTFNNPTILLLDAHGYVWEAADRFPCTVPMPVKVKPKSPPLPLSPLMTVFFGFVWFRSLLDRSDLFQIWACLVQNRVELSSSWKSIFNLDSASHRSEKTTGRECSQATIANALKTGRFSWISIKPVRFSFVSLVKIDRFEFNFFKNLRKFEIKIF